MGKRMTNAPVYYVVAQVRFSPVLTMDQYIPSIQDSLRRIGFPDFQKLFTTTLNLNFGGNPAPEQPQNAVAQPQAQSIFFNEARDSGFVLDSSSLSFQTARYETFEVFLSALMRGILIVHRYAEPSYYERIGIRYLDAVVPRAGEHISQYLEPYVLGLVGRLKDRQLVHSISETRTKSDHGELMSRAIVLNQDQAGNVAFPPDLIGGPLPKLLDKFSQVKGEYGIIDTDSSQGKRTPFEPQQIEATMTELHIMIRQSFDLMVTKHAMYTWE